MDGEDVEEDNMFRLITECFTKLGNSILNEDPQQTELYFLEYSLEGILDIMVDGRESRMSSREAYI